MLFPIQTKDSLLAIAKILAKGIQFIIDFNPSMPDIAATKMSTFCLEESIIACFPD